MEFQQLINRAMGIRKKYEAKEKRLYGSAWTNEEIAFMEAMDRLEAHLLETQK